MLHSGVNTGAGHWSRDRRRAGRLACRSPLAHPLQFRRPVLATRRGARGGGTSTGWVEERDARTKTAHWLVMRASAGAGNDPVDRPRRARHFPRSQRDVSSTVRGWRVLTRRSSRWDAALLTGCEVVPSQRHELRGQLSRSEHLDRLLARPSTGRAALHAHSTPPIRGPPTPTTKPTPAPNWPRWASRSETRIGQRGHQFR